MSGCGATEAAEEAAEAAEEVAVVKLREAINYLLIMQNPN